MRAKFIDKLSTTQDTEAELRQQISAAVQTFALDWNVYAVMAQCRRMILQLQTVIESADDSNMAGQTPATATGRTRDMIAVMLGPITIRREADGVT